MKIVVGGAIVDPQWPGGETLITQQLVDGLRRAGDEVQTIAHRRAGVYLAATAVSPIDFDPVNVGRYRTELARADPDCVLAFYDYDSSLCVAATGLGIPLVSCVQIHWPLCPMATLYLDGQGICTGPGFAKCVRHLHRNPPPLHLEGRSNAVPLPAAAMIYTKFVSRGRFLQDADAFVVPSARSRDLLLARGFERIHVIPNSIDVAQFQSTTYGGGPKIVLSPSGSISERKGFFDFQEVARRLSGLRPDVRFAANNYPGDEWIDGAPMLGRSQMIRAFQTAYVIVLPVRWDEPFGIVAIEAMAAGRPVIAYANGAMPEIISDGETGLLIPPGRIDELAGAVQRLVDDPDRANRMGRAGRRRAEQLFDARTMVQSYREVTRGLVEAPLTRPR